MPRVSILLPTHNRSELLRLSVASVLAQSVTDFEILVVGDGCTDDTGEMLERFADERIRFFDLPKGPGFGYANRNIALRQASGELIAFASDDDLMFPDHLALLVHHFDQDQVMWAYSRPLFIRTDGVVLPTFANLKQPMARTTFMTQMNMIAAGCVMHRRRCFEENGYWPEDMEAGGDWDLWRRILRDRSHRAISFERRPTQLHFKAGWRQDDLLWPRFLAYLSAMADSTAAWHRGLQLPQVDGESLQASSWRAMQEHPTRFIGQLREGVEILGDRLAWSASQSTDFR